MRPPVRLAAAALVAAVMLVVPTVGSAEPALTFEPADPVVPAAPVAAPTTGPVPGAEDAPAIVGGIVTVPPPTAVAGATRAPVDQGYSRAEQLPFTGFSLLGITLLGSVTLLAGSILQRAGRARGSRPAT